MVVLERPQRLPETFCSWPKETERSLEAFWPEAFWPEAPVEEKNG